MGQYLRNGCSPKNKVTPMENMQGLLAEQTKAQQEGHANSRGLCLVWGDKFPHIPQCPAPIKWRHPQPTLLKCNVDDALFFEENAIGVGMVLKDSHGTVVDHKLRRINGLCQPKEAESISVKEDLARLK